MTVTKADVTQALHINIAPADAAAPYSVLTDKRNRAISELDYCACSLPLSSTTYVLIYMHLVGLQFLFLASCEISQRLMILYKSR